MEYVYVKDSEGYVFKKLASEVTADEKIITEREGTFTKCKSSFFCGDLSPLIEICV